MQLKSRGHVFLQLIKKQQILFEVGSIRLMRVQIQDSFKPSFDHEVIVVKPVKINVFSIMADITYFFCIKYSHIII